MISFRSRALVCVALAAALAAATVLAGWVGVPVVAALFGLAVAGRFRHAAGTAGVAALLAWAALLAFDATGGRFGALATSLTGVMQLGHVAIVAVTLVYPLLMAWSAAALADAAAARLRPRRDPAAAAADAGPPRAVGGESHTAAERPAVSGTPAR